MSYSPPLGSPITHTHMRTPGHLSGFSGMCSVCSSECSGTCEIGLSAIRGSEAINPYASDLNQFASEKRYPLDFSHFNINGRVFGAIGCAEDSDAATFPKANIHATFGLDRKIQLEAPFILPAMAKLNWKDYFAGAALAGVLVVIGEDVVAKDKGLVMEHGRVKDSPLIEEMLNAFRKHHRGCGEIILQANFDDEAKGVLDYAITKLGVKSVELKFGQAAKGIQGMGRVQKIEDALKFKEMGYLIYPDPTDPVIASEYAKGHGQVFEKIGRLPMWNLESLANRISELRGLGAERISFKTGPFAPEDLVTILSIASECGVDLITFDGAGGGTGHSPTKMMNEWGIPTVYLESMLHPLLEAFHARNKPLPQIAIAGGFTTEDHVFKGLALGAPHINLIGIGRAAMTAAMVGQRIGQAIKDGTIPKEYTRFGSSLEDLFCDLRILKSLYGQEAVDLSPGAIGVYSYLNRISVGLKQFMALNRKFSLEHIDRRDILPLTDLAASVSGIETCNQRMAKTIHSL